jgi:hypothetical protein
MNIEPNRRSERQAPPNALDQAFEDLARNLFAALDSPVPEMEGAGDPIRVIELAMEDVLFWVSLNRILSDEVFFVACEFGAIPPLDPVNVIAQLMRMNHLLFEQNAGCFSLNTETDSVQFTFRWPVEQRDADSLLQAMARIFEQVRLWQATYFLDADAALLTGNQDVLRA